MTTPTATTYERASQVGEPPCGRYVDRDANDHWYCTRAVGHPLPHAAHNATTGEVMHAWPETVVKYALVTTEGTAMSETGICGGCRQAERNVQQARDWAENDWDGGDFHDVTANEAISCQFCGLGDVPVGEPFPDRPGYLTGECGHAVAGSEWRAGFRVCERC